MELNENVISSQDNNPSDSEKCFLIYNLDSKSAFRLKDIIQETFHGIPCIRGTSILDNHWSQGKTIHIPVDHIFQIIEFDSIESLQKARKRPHRGMLRSIFRNSR